MNVLKLIELLKKWPDQNDIVIFTHASEIDGDIVYREITGVQALIYEDIYDGNAKIKAVELV